MVNIFEKGEELSGTWFNFKNIGDSIQGTYVGKKESVDGYNNIQIIYQLKVDGSGLVNVGIRKSKTKIHELMNNVRLGQIVGFKYTENIANEGKNDTKVYKIYADESIVDEEWLKNYEKTGGINIDNEYQGEEEKEIGDGIDAESMFEDKGVEVEETEEEKMAQIVDMAITKLEIKDDDPNKIKEIVMEKTGIPFVASNLDKIHEALKNIK